MPISVIQRTRAMAVPHLVRWDRIRRRPALSILACGHRVKSWRRKRAADMRMDLAARFRPTHAEISAPGKSEGAGNAGCSLHPRSRVQDAHKNAHTRLQVQS